MEIWSPALLDLMIVGLAIAGITLLGLHLLHHTWTASGGVPFSSLALLLSSTTLAVARKRLPWYRAGYWRREDRRLLAIAAIVLALACVLVALFTIGTMADAHRKSLIDALQADRDAVRGAVAGSIRIRTAEVLDLSRSDQLRQLLEERAQSPTADPDISDFVAALHAIKPLHYAVFGASGQLLMGERPSKPLSLIELPVRVDGDAQVRLARARDESGLILRVLAPIRHADKTLGELAVDLPLPAASASFAGLLVHHPLTLLHLCARPTHGEGVFCLDARPGQNAFRVDSNSNAPELRSTVGEHASIVLEHNGSGHVVSYGPIGDTGLGVVVSTPAKALLSPVLGAVKTALLLAPGVIVLGLLLLAWQMRPLARSLHQQRNMLKTAFEFSGIGIQILDADGQMIDCNPAFAAMLGCSREELLATSYDYALIHESERELAQNNIRDISQSQIGPYCADRRYRHKNGGYRTLRWHVSPVRDPQGQTEYIACFCIDATDAIAKADTLRFQTAFFHAVLDDLHDVVYAANADGILIYANRAAARAGIPAQMALSLPELARISPVFDAEHRPVSENQMPLETALRGESMHRREFTIRNLAGQWREYQISAYPLRTSSGQALGAVGVAHDVTDLRASERHLRWLLEHDELTRLPNRYAAQRLVAARLAAQEPLAMALLDIDRFKHINDSYGHAFGDQLLHSIAERLGSLFGLDAPVFRLGSDEFLVVARCAEPDKAATTLSDRTLQAFDSAFEIGGQTLFVSATAGLVCAPDDGDTADTLFARVDVAMYRAKQQMPGSALRWRDELGLRSREQVEMETELRSALARGQFEVFYQPKICLRSGRIVGAEALLRWRHPQRGLVSPAAFIPLLEETGLIVPVGAWTLQTVCDQQSLWREAGVPVMPIAVNCSVRQLQGDVLLRQVETALGAAQCEPSLLELEITESMMLHDPDGVSALVSALKARGVLTSIDDFGTGYSSLASLKKLPVAALKLDRAFVKDLPDDVDDAAITRAVLSMARALNIDVIAEGVETLEQVAFLAELGCAAYQGYLYSPPIPADEFSRMLRRQSP